MSKKSKKNQFTPEDPETLNTASCAEEPVDTPEDAPAGTPAPESSAGDAGALPELGKQLAAMTEKYVRLAAEFDNYRKRACREMDSAAALASEKLVLQFLPILDNLDRATEHKNDKTTFEDYVTGIALIEEQLRRVLAQTGLRKMEVIGEQFDPAAHSAVMQAESKEHGSGVVIAEVEKGYTLGEKIIRHPSVVVSK